MARKREVPTNPFEVIAKQVALLGETVLKDPKKFVPEIESRLAAQGCSSTSADFANAKLRVLEYLAMYRSRPRRVA